MIAYIRHVCLVSRMHREQIARQHVIDGRIRMLSGSVGRVPCARTPTAGGSHDSSGNETSERVQEGRVGRFASSFRILDTVIGRTFPYIGMGARV